MCVFGLGSLRKHSPFLFPKYRYLCFVAGGSPAGYSLSGDSVCVVVQLVRAFGRRFKSGLRIISFGFLGFIARFAERLGGFFHLNVKV